MFWRVSYHSMTATYGPSFIEAEDEEEAKRKFARGAFSKGEMSLIKARPVSADEMRRALNAQEER